MEIEYVKPISHLFLCMVFVFKLDKEGIKTLNKKMLQPLSCHVDLCNKVLEI